MILLGGVPGTGKSTAAAELANRLGVARTQSTDMLREVMRILIPERLSPPLHTSSFNAGGAVDTGEMFAVRDAENLLYGFHRQTELVELACQAVLQRAIDERVSLILEGVHVRPTLRRHIAQTIAQKNNDGKNSYANNNHGKNKRIKNKRIKNNYASNNCDAVIVPIALCVLDKDTLISHIKRRKTETQPRRAARYLDKIDDIWQLQSALLSEADGADIQIINNLDGEKTVSEIIKTITLTIAATYSRAQIAKIETAMHKAARKKYKKVESRK